eukprot:CAMPEP_0204351042 /NCGR_PEP_ID=MMETSP0469-20131031/30800_1 /ASSEMBLY_ACC=CAM_ASM_000384 /TAXON_ID=2969 /ORGANISM="Oxyrrhis marina" /LENGTH=577 /DNA_ID=CAMNT_0051337505 /DNA_START=33 /DNA_END=1763 /DNA_ORIENTATION=+
MVETLYAALAYDIAAPPGSPSTRTVDACVLRQWAAMHYFLTVRNPWQWWPVLVKHDWDQKVMECDWGEDRDFRPFGPTKVSLYPDMGYAMIRAPLLENCSDWICDGSALPRLTDAKGYSMMAIQGRPNELPHSEVDFATFKWTAFGVQMISEHGYGTISTGVGEWDFRRFTEIDNNAAGHNTLVINEAFVDDKINFSQLHYRKGTTEVVTGVDLHCVKLDGSDVYGSGRDNGWFDSMQRYFCEVATGQYVMVDSFHVKQNRKVLELYGSLYGGPDYNEGSVHSELTVDEYFHTPSWLDGKDLSTMTDEEMAFSREKANNKCQHVDVELDADGVALISGCAFTPASLEGDATGKIISWSREPGSFVLDGLVTATSTWGSPTMHINRFRYTPTAPTGTGDLRAFVMTAGLKPDAPPPAWVKSCPAQPDAGTCLSVCVASRYFEFVVVEGAAGDLVSAVEMGQCDGENLAAEVVTTTTTRAPEGETSFTFEVDPSKLALGGLDGEALGELSQQVFEAAVTSLDLGVQLATLSLAQPSASSPIVLILEFAGGVADASYATGRAVGELVGRELRRYAAAVVE